MSTIRKILQDHGDRGAIIEYERECSDAALLAAYVFLDARPDSQEYAVARRIVLRASADACAACGETALLRHDGFFHYATPTETIDLKLCDTCWFDGDNGPSWHARMRKQIFARRGHR